MTPFIKNARSLLMAGRLSDAIRYMRKRLIADRNSRGLDSLDQIDRNYGFLLKFLADGQPDPTRRQMFSNIREQLFTLLRSIEFEMNLAESTLLFYTQSRTVKYSGLTFQDALGRFIMADSSLKLLDDQSADRNRLMADKDRAIKDIFTIVWTLPISKADELKAIVASASDNDTPFELRALIASALMMNLLFVYDRGKMTGLIDILLRSNSSRLDARVLTGILLVLNRHYMRVNEDYEVRLRFETLSERPQFSSQLHSVIFSLVKARGGINLLKKIESEILPDIMKMGAGFMEKFKNDEGKIDIESIEQNPEWEKLLNGRIGKKLRKLNDIQSDGGDVMLSMFSKLVGSFHYFNDIDVWFRPFCTWEAERIGVPQQVVGLWDKMPMNNAICDIDKYVLALNMTRLPESARSMMTGPMEAQFDQMQEEMKDMQLHSARPEFELEADNYAKCLFRFFNYFRLHREFNNPFGQPLDIFNLPFIGDLATDDETVSELADFYFRQAFYEDAIKCLERMIKIDPLNEPLYVQKIGFCYEKTGKLQEAFTYYDRSFDTGNDDKWLLQRIFKIGHQIGETRKSYEALCKLLQSDNDNLDLLMQCASMMMDFPELNTANLNKILQKLHYMQPDNQRIIRMMAVNALRNGDSAEAERLMASRMDDIAMYLAEQELLKATAQSDSQSVFNEEPSDASVGENQAVSEQEEMWRDLLVAASTAFVANDLRTAISDLSKALTIGDARSQRSAALEILTNGWRKIPALRDHIDELPMYLEAAQLR